MDLNILYLFKNMVEEISLQMASFASQIGFWESSWTTVSLWICASQKLSCGRCALIKVWGPGRPVFSSRIHSTHFRWSGTLNWIQSFCPPSRKRDSCSVLHKVHPQGQAQCLPAALLNGWGSWMGSLCSPGAVPLQLQALRETLAHATPFLGWKLYLAKTV